MTRHRGVLITALWLAGVSAAGCGSGSDADAYLVRDSAGVRIVENRAPQWAADEGWRVAANPSIVIGARAGDPRASLHNVQGVRRLRDGRIVIANDGSKQLLFFDSAGRYLEAVGGQGDGPGEFQFLTALWLCGDSLRVYDGRLSRLSVFDPDGRFARSVQVRLPTRSQPPVNLDCQDDGTMILSDWGDPIRGGGIYRPVISVMVADAAGEIVATVGKFPGREYADGFISAPAFGKQTSIRLESGRAYVGTADHYQIEVYDLAGALQMQIRKAADPVRVTDDDISRHKQSVLGAIADPELRRRRLLLGVMKDEFDVERVVLHRLIRP